MSNKRKKSPVRGSVDLPGSTAVVSRPDDNQQGFADEKITVEGEAADVYEHKDNADEVKTHTQSGTDRQEAQQTDVSSAATVDTGQESNTNAETWIPLPLRSNGSIQELQTRANTQGDEYDDDNPGQRDEDGIRAATEVALRKLNEADAKTKEDYDKVEAEDEKRKSDIIRDYAKTLEGKIPTGSIASEAVHQLVDAEKARHGKSKVSKRLIYKCLEAKYKRQWQKKHEDEDQDRNQDLQQGHQSAPVHFDKKVIPVITLGGGNETVAEPTSTDNAAGTAEQRPEVSKPAPIITPVEHDLKSTESEQPAAKAQPQQSEVDPEQVLQEPSHKIRILLSWDSLSEQMARAHSPGIEWVWVSGVLNEKSRIVSNLKLERGEVLK